MKVLGQLEKAQLENLANASPTPTPIGRVYSDISSPGKALPRFFDGTQWQQIQLGYQASLKYKTALQTISFLTNTNTKTVYDSQVWDTDNIYDPTTGLFVPKATTKYVIKIAVLFAAGTWNVNSLFRALINDNTASAIIARQTKFTPANTGAGYANSGLFIFEEILIAGHTYEVDIGQQATTAVVLNGDDQENWIAIDTAY